MARQEDTSRDDRVMRPIPEQGHRAGCEVKLDIGIIYTSVGRWLEFPIDHGRITIWVMAHPEDPEGTLRVREGDNADYTMLPGRSRIPGDSGLYAAAESNHQFGHFVVYSEGHS